MTQEKPSIIVTHDHLSTRDTVKVAIRHDLEGSGVDVVSLPLEEAERLIKEQIDNVRCNIIALITGFNFRSKRTETVITTRGSSTLALPELEPAGAEIISQAVEKRIPLAIIEMYPDDLPSDVREQSTVINISSDDFLSACRDFSQAAARKHFSKSSS